VPRFQDSRVSATVKMGSSLFDLRLYQPHLIGCWSFIDPRSENSLIIRKYGRIAETVELPGNYHSTI
jgi:hypothetical protein